MPIHLPTLSVETQLGSKALNGSREDLIDITYGWLNYQAFLKFLVGALSEVEHHMFPDMTPLQRLQSLVRERSVTGTGSCSRW